MSAARRTDEALWERIKTKWMRGAKGGPAGKWNARKAQLAVLEYKDKGGGYLGAKRADNSLKKWTDEDWGYIDGKDGNRYLPKKVRDSLTPQEKRRENRRKKGREGEWVPYSDSVASKMRKAGVFGPARGGAGGTASRSQFLTREGMERYLPRCRPLSWYVPGRKIEVSDRMQKGYSYRLSAPRGRAGFPRGFAPELTPRQMLRLGSFEGKYLNDCMGEFPREWYAGMLRAGTASPEGPDPGVNLFGVKSRKSLKYWKRKGWIPITGSRKTDPDVRGWFQWYCRYWLGRRDPEVDDLQIARWRAFTRHAGQIKASYRRAGSRPRSKAEKKNHRPRQRQALLQWAYDPWV